ncbi:calcium-binding protein [Bradyrhizobium diazoefficiens]
MTAVDRDGDASTTGLQVDLLGSTNVASGVTLSDPPQPVTTAVNGTNDGATLSGTATGSMIEAAGGAPGTPTASGALANTDVNPPNTFTAVRSPTASDGGYGMFTMTAAGLWTYTLDNNNSVVQALDVGDTLTDTFTVTTIDGTTQVVTIAAYGAGDAPNGFDNLAAGPAVTSDPPFAPVTHGSETIAAGGDVGQIISTGAGKDTVNGTGQADILHGGSGNDTIKGNDGDDTTHGGAGIDAVNGNKGNETIIGGFGADQLTGGTGNDRFVHLSAADSKAGQFGTITDLNPGSDKIDLTALGGLGFVLLALSSASTSVPAHTIAWLYDSAANETIVYVNPSDQTLHIGDSGLIEIHLQGIATIDASDFTLTPAAAAVLAAGSDPLDLSATTQSDATAVTTTSSSETTLSDGTLLADWNATDRSTDQAHSVFASSDQFAWTEHPSFASSDGVQPHAAEITSSDAVMPAPSGLSTILHDEAAPTATSFVFDQLTLPDSTDTTIGNNDAIAESAPMPEIAFAALQDAAEQLARHGRTLEKGNEDHGASAPDSAHNAAHAHGGASHSLPSEAAGQHDAPKHGPVDVDPPSAGHAAHGSAPAGSHQVGDSFDFKDGASHGQGPEHGVQLDDPSDPSGHHEHAGKAHESEAASMHELSPSHIDPAHGAGTTGAHVLHDLIV